MYVNCVIKCSKTKYVIVGGKQSVLDHIYVEHLKAYYKCDLCGRTYYSNAAFIDHCADRHQTINLPEPSLLQPDLSKEQNYVLLR